MSVLKTPLDEDELLHALRSRCGPVLSLGLPEPKPVEECITTNVDDREHTLTIQVRSTGRRPSNVSVVLEGALLKVLVRVGGVRVERSFMLSAALDLERLSVTLRDRVLTVSVPKLPAVPRIIRVQVA